MPAVTILIPEEMMEFVTKQRKKKGYLNVSEYFRSLLRTAQEKESVEKIEDLLMKGLEAGDDNKFTREFWRDLKTEAVNLVNKRHQEKFPNHD